MRFITSTLIVHAPDPVTGAQVSTADRFRAVVDSDDAVPASAAAGITEDTASDAAVVSPVAATG
jgi:hypothetical protein